MKCLWCLHGVGEPECVVNVGVSGPGVVQRALEAVRGEPFDVVAETIKRTAFKITRVGELVAQEAAKRLGVPFGIVDLSLAPTPARGDSVAYILKEMGLEMAGAPGTTAALAMAKQLEPEMSMHFARWSEENDKAINIDSPTTPEGALRYWYTRLDYTRNVLRKRPRYFYEMVQERLTLTDEQMQSYFGTKPELPDDAVFTQGKKWG